MGFETANGNGNGRLTMDAHASQDNVMAAAMALIKATPSDLAELDNKIADAEQVLAALRSFRKLMAQRLNRSEPRPPTGSGGKLRDRLHEYCKSHKSPTVEEVKSDLNITGQALHTCVRKSGGKLRIVDGRMELTKA